MKKKVFFTLSLLFLLAGAGCGGWYVFAHDQPTALSVRGSVEQRQVDLAFMDSGRIVEVLVEEGELVEKGQVLARLDARRLWDSIAVQEAQVASAEAALARLQHGPSQEEIEKARAAVAAAQAEVNFADEQYNRYFNIWRNSAGMALSKQDVDEVQLKQKLVRAKLKQQQQALRLAEKGPRQADLEAARAEMLVHSRALEELRNRLADTELKSPASAIVWRRMLEPGDIASPQKAVLALAVRQPKWVRVLIDEDEAAGLRAGMGAEVLPTGHPDMHPVPGRVGPVHALGSFTARFSQSRQESGQKQYEVRIYVDDPEDILQPGMTATVRFEGELSVATQKRQRTPS